MSDQNNIQNPTEYSLQQNQSEQHEDATLKKLCVEQTREENLQNEESSLKQPAPQVQVVQKCQLSAHNIEENGTGIATLSKQKSKQQPQSTYTYHNNNPNHIITNIANDNEWECIDCSKRYKSYPAFYTHNKIKHQGNPPNMYKIPRPLDSISKDRGRPKADKNLRSKFTDMDQKQHNLEDQIYEYLAKAGQNEDQENKVIRQYLNPQVNPIEAMPDFNVFEDTFLAETAQNIRKEINKLEDICRQYEDFQFMDPMDLSDPIDEEINLSNLKYLFQHYKQNGLLTEHSIIAIFLAWIGKELRQDSYQEVCLISISFFSLCAAQQTELKVTEMVEFKPTLERNHTRVDLFAQRKFPLKIFANLVQFMELISHFKAWMVFWIDILALENLDDGKQGYQDASVGLSNSEAESCEEDDEDEVEGSEDNAEKRKQKHS